VVEKPCGQARGRIAGHFAAGVSEPVLARAVAYWSNVDPVLGATIAKAFGQ
jgi:hypothetical protein